MSDFWKAVIGTVAIVGVVLAVTWNDPFAHFETHNGLQVRTGGK